jgi:hypothetical protein
MSIEDLQQEAERAEAEAQRLMAEKDELRDALRGTTCGSPTSTG